MERKHEENIIAKAEVNAVPPQLENKSNLKNTPIVDSEDVELKKQTSLLTEMIYQMSDLDNIMDLAQTKPNTASS